MSMGWLKTGSDHDDVIKWKHFPRYWPLVWGIHRSPVNSPHKGQWRGALMFSLICVWINGWVNNRESGDLRHYRAHYDDNVMLCPVCHPKMNHWIYLTTLSQFIMMMVLHENIFMFLDKNPPCGIRALIQYLKSIRNHIVEIREL